MPLRQSASRVATTARTRYYRTRYQGLVAWGAAVEVAGRLVISGAGRVVIGDRCVLGGGRIHAGPLATVRIGDDCRLNNLEIQATHDVTFGAGVQVRAWLRIDGAGRVRFGDGCKINALDITSGCEVTVGPNVRVRAEGTLAGPGRAVIGDDCVVEPRGLRIYTEGPDATVRIGKYCGINGLEIHADADVTIGDRCMIGDCSISTTGFHGPRPDRPTQRVHAVPGERGPVRVGSNVWLAHQALIDPGVSIGDNSVVSVGTMVREDVPANVIVSSHEQRVVKDLTGSATWT